MQGSQKNKESCIEVLSGTFAMMAQEARASLQDECPFLLKHCFHETFEVEDGCGRVDCGFVIEQISSGANRDGVCVQARHS